MEIYIYDGSRSSKLNVPEIAQYAREELRKASVEVRRDIVQRSLQKLPEAALAFARAKVLDPIKKIEDRDPLPGEVSYEENRLSDTKNMTFGNIYDGFIIQEHLGSFIPKEELTLRSIHIVLTNQLLATFDEGDLRYHIRSGIFGIPSVISSTGLVEGPARPREFYLLKQSMGPHWDGAAMAQAAEEFRDRMVDHNDPRLTEVMKGYVMQAVFYNLTGAPFCEDVNCRLFNAHWQEEMIKAQLTSPYEFCPKHEKALQTFRTFFPSPQRGEGSQPEADASRAQVRE